MSLILSLGMTFTHTATAFAGELKGNFNFSPRETLTTLAGLTSQHLAKIAPVQSPSTETAQNQPIYVYGETSEPYQIGKEYMVFTRSITNPQQIIGAVYLPDAEYNCFSGTLEKGRVTMNLVDNYEGTIYPYSVMIETTDLVAALLPMRSRSYQAVHKIGKHDLEMINSCQAALGN
jgi:hypothetical protein